MLADGATRQRCSWCIAGYNLGVKSDQHCVLDVGCDGVASLLRCLLAPGPIHEGFVAPDELKSSNVVEAVEKHGANFRNESMHNVELIRKAS